MYKTSILQIREDLCNRASPSSVTIHRSGANGASSTTAASLGHGRLPLRNAQDISSKTSKCLPILSHYRQLDLQEVKLIEYLKKVKPGWWEA